MKKLLISGLIVSSVFLGSCGGGGGGSSSGTSGGSGSSGGTDGGTGGGTTATPTYLAYVLDYTKSYTPYLDYQDSLYLVDPSNPSSIVSISKFPIIDNGSLLVFGNYNSQNYSYTDLHVHEIYYIEEIDADTTTINGGLLKKISMVKGSSTPTPVQVSNLGNVCNIIFREKDAINKKTYMQLKTAGPDGKCHTSDDEFYFVNSTMGISDKAIPLKGKSVIASLGGYLLNSGIGSVYSRIGGYLLNLSITGFLVYNKNNSTIEKCDLNLNNCTPIESGALSVNYIASNPNNGEVFLCVNGNLKRFNGTSLNGTSANCDTTWNYYNDNQAIYAVDNNKNILKFPYIGSNWQTIYNGGYVLSSIYMTKNYLIFEDTNNNLNNLKVLKKDGTSLINIYTFNKNEADTGIGIYTTSNKFLITIINNSTQKACVWEEGTTSLTCEDNAYWAGVSIAPNGTLDVSITFPFPAYKILKVENVTSVLGGTLYAIDPSNLNSKINLGNVPTAYDILFTLGLGDNILLRCLENSFPLQFDVFFTNISQFNSLKQITNTPDKVELSLNFWY